MVRSVVILVIWLNGRRSMKYNNFGDFLDDWGIILAIIGMVIIVIVLKVYYGVAIP